MLWPCIRTRPPCPKDHPHEVSTAAANLGHNHIARHPSCGVCNLPILDTAMAADAH